MGTLSIEDFGAQLLKTQDLDPVYVALQGSNIDAATKRRLCLAYWSYYHLGFASWAAEKKGAKYWEAMMRAAHNIEPCWSHPSGRWPRGAERRHFRGQQGVRAVAELSGRYAKPEGFCDYVFESRTPTFIGVSTRVREHRGFGDWIAFKIADMGERVLGEPVDFSDCELGIYKDPRQGAALAYFMRMSAQLDTPFDPAYVDAPWKYPIGDEGLKAEVAHWVQHFKKFKPPGGGRAVGVQEVETVFCKYKSHVRGHYPVGKDTREIREGLHGWGDLAQQLERSLPK